MFNSTEEVGDYRFVRRDFHTDGTVFYDVFGHAYLLNRIDKRVTRLTQEPDESISAALAPFPTDRESTPFLRKAAVMCGSGVFRRLSRRTDPRELYDIEYYGELMYNMEADADLRYLILNRFKLSSTNNDPIEPRAAETPESPGEMTIRGSFRRIAIIASDITESKITIISDTNPEIFIIGSNLSASSIQIVDGEGNEYVNDRICISETIPPEEELEQLLEYVRSDAEDVVPEMNEPDNGGVLAAGAAACLAVASLVAAAGAKKAKKTKKVRRAVVHAEAVR